jgi:uncharacterized protein (DUF983 family)
MIRPLRLFSRALVLRCPNCGGRPIFRSWFQLVTHCPRCGLKFEREEGFFLGGMVVNLFIGEFIPIVGAAVTWYLTRPTPPWQLIQYGWIASAIVLPLLFFPLSRTLWLAFDLTFRPAEIREYDRPERSNGHAL